MNPVQSFLEVVSFTQMIKMYFQVPICLLIFKFLGSILAVHHAVRVAENCVNLHPALFDQARGYDIADHSSKGPAIPSQHKLFNPIIQFTCNWNKTHKYPFGGPWYQIPDQLEIRNLPVGRLRQSSKCYHDTVELTEALYYNIQEWEKRPLGSFTTTNNSPNMLTIPPSARCLIRIIIRGIQFQATIADSYSEVAPLLAPEFNESLNALPIISKADPSTYAKFIREFGTGYFNKGFYGNALDLWVLTDVSITNGQERVFEMLHSFEESTETDVGRWIKQNVQTLFPGSNPTVFVRHSGPGRWSEMAVNLIDGNFFTFGRINGILSGAPRVDNLEEAIAAHLISAGVKKNWLGNFGERS